MGKPYCDARAESVARAGGVAYIDFPCRENAVFARERRVYRAFAAHRDDHRRNFRAFYILSELRADFFRRKGFAFAQKQLPRLLEIAHEAVNLLQKLAPLRGDADVGDNPEYLLAVFFRKMQNVLDNAAAKVHFQNNTVAIGENLVTFFLNKPFQRGGVGAV